eukprot:PhF_6_TR20119/c0_g1_i1/m.29256
MCESFVVDVAAQITDLDMAHLSLLTSLTSLDLSHIEITDEGLELTVGVGIIDIYHFVSVVVDRLRKQALYTCRRLSHSFASISVLFIISQHCSTGRHKGGDH